MESGRFLIAPLIPLRIFELRYIKRKHQKIPEKMIKGNQDVKWLSYCNACHTKAEEGMFDNDTVSIPNYPEWKAESRKRMRVAY